MLPRSNEKLNGALLGALCVIDLERFNWSHKHVDKKRTMWTILRPKGSTQDSQKSKTATVEQMKLALFRRLCHITDKVSKFPNLSNNKLTIDNYLNALLPVVSWNKKRIPFTFTIGWFKLALHSLEFSVLLLTHKKSTFDRVEFFTRPKFSGKTSGLISTKSCLFRSCWSSKCAIRDTMLTQKRKKG